jgi:DNA-binding NarL/FixJ family response regulator
VRVVLVDDHEMLRAGVREFLASCPGYDVVGEAATARASFPVVESEKPDVVLMDIALPGMDGVVATAEILRRVPRTRIVILSAHHQVQDVADAMNAGAIAYVLKADPVETLLRALELAARGMRYVAPLIAARLSAFEASRPKRNVLDILSTRERELSVGSRLPDRA